MVGTIILCAQCILRQMVALGELLALISIVFGFLLEMGSPVLFYEPVLSDS